MREVILSTIAKRKSCVAFCFKSSLESRHRSPRASAICPTHLPRCLVAFYLVYSQEDEFSRTEAIKLCLSVTRHFPYDELGSFLDVSTQLNPAISKLSLITLDVSNTLSVLGRPWCYYRRYNRLKRRNRGLKI